MDYHNILKTKIRTMITNDLTIGRIDYDLIPFTSEQIDKLIENNDTNIEIAIASMIADYTMDNTLEMLDDPLFDWIGEYLYEYVDTRDSGWIENYLYYVDRN